MDDEGLMVEDNFMVLNFEPEMPEETWGFVSKGESTTTPPSKTRQIVYHNTPYIFRNVAYVRFLSYMPPLKRDGTAYWRFDRYHRKVQLIPYRVIAKCGEEWVHMALLPTIGFHKLIQKAFKEHDVWDYDVHNHLWKVYKGHREGYDTGKWGIEYYEFSKWEDEDLQNPVPLNEVPANSPWKKIPNAEKVAREIRKKVLPHYPAVPRDDVYMREIMERLACSYETAKLLYTHRKEVGLP